MKKVILGTVLGAALGYVARKIHEEGYLDQVYDQINKFTAKTKKNFNNIVDESKNETEYLKDRVKKYGENTESFIQEE